LSSAFASRAEPGERRRGVSRTAAPPIRHAGSAKNLPGAEKPERRKAVEPESRLYGETVIAS